MSKTKKYLLPVLFLGVLLSHGLDSIFHFIPPLDLEERRALTKKPELNIDHLDPFPRDYEAYYNDHFTWRNYFIRANSYLNYHAFRQSALPNKVIIGKSGWLFKSGFQRDMYRGQFQFSQAQLEEIKQELESRKQQVEAIGGRYYLSIPPMKTAIYSEFLPDNFNLLNEQTCTQQLITYLADHTSISYIDLFSPIKELKENGSLLLYFKTDHHWTDYTGVFAAKIIMDQLQQDFPELATVDTAQFSYQQATFDGMLLAEMLGLEKEMQEVFPLFDASYPFLAQDGSRAYPIPGDFPFPDEYCLIKETDQKELPKLMMVRESFANPMVKILGDHFRESVFLFDNWKHQFHAEILEEEQPDIYIQLIWEGMIYTLLDNPPTEAGW